MHKDLEDLLKRITQKKVLLDSKRPLPVILEKNLGQRSKVSLIYTSNAIEGNSLTEKETAQILEKEITVGGKTVLEHLEVIGHSKAIDFIFDLSKKKKRAELSVRDVLEIHRELFLPIDSSYAGLLRQVMVRISGSVVSRPNYIKLPDLMEGLLKSLRETVEHVVKVAADAHLDFVFIHPFIDGNGRTARLLLNLVLLEEGYPLVKINNTIRSAYINSIEKALLGEGKEDYYRVIFQSVEESLDAYLESVLG